LVLISFILSEDEVFLKWVGKNIKKSHPSEEKWDLKYSSMCDYIFDKSGASRVKAGIPVTSIPVINK